MSALAEPPTKDPPPDSPAERRLVLDYVRHSWSRTVGETECEDAVSEAYVSLLDRLSRGERPDNRIGWLIRTAWQIANDAHRRNMRRATFWDWDDAELEDVPDPARSLEEYVDLRDLDGRLKEAYRQLPKPQRLALASQFADGLSEKQACRRLGCWRSTLMRRRAKARQYLYAAVSAENERFDDTVIALMSAYLAGTASAEQRERVHELTARSPYYAARFAELRAVEQRLPAIVPPIAFAGPAIFERVGSMVGNLRDAIHALLVRNPESTEAATTPALASGTGKVGGATAGGVGGALSSLGGAKLVVGCLSGAAAASACVAAVVGVPRIGGDNDKQESIERNADRDRGRSSLGASLATPGNPTQTAASASSQAAAPGSQPNNTTNGDRDPDESGSPPNEPSPAQESSDSDFSFSTETSAPSTSTEPRAPTSSPTPDSPSGSSSEGGGGASGSGGDFSFGSP